MGASKKCCENFTASDVADVTISFSLGHFFTAQDDEEFHKQKRRKQVPSDQSSGETKRITTAAPTPRDPTIKTPG
jgi:hypothetical protein